jgi:hypothetical protein
LRLASRCRYLEEVATTPRRRAGSKEQPSRATARAKATDVAPASDDRTERLSPSAAPEVRVRVYLGGREWTVDDDRPKLSLGRAPENDVVVDDERVSRRHAELVRGEGGIYVRDHSTNGTYLASGIGRVTRVHGETLPLAWTARLHLGWTGGPEIALVLEERSADSGGWLPVEGRFDAVDPAESTFRREGEYWTIAHAGRVLRLRDTRGLAFLAHLLQHAGVEVLAIDLVQQIAIEPDVSRPSSSSGVSLLDARAKADYRRRLEGLESQLEEAERFSDVERASRAREEIEVISRELSRAVGIGGRDRSGSDDSERARVLVTVRVREALRRIADGAPELGAHLTASIKTGRYCSYRPPAGQEIGWKLA